MENIHAINDAIIRARNELIIYLNILHKIDPKDSYDKYMETLEALEKYFKGSNPEI